jgi:hypothetical protein
MKKELFIIVTSLLVMTSCEKNDTKDPFTEYTVAMGTNSASDVYFKLANGEIKAVTRSDWDLAFSVPLQTATILINEGAGVELYCVGDTNQWESIDENTIDNLQKRYNDESDWFAGAFNVNASGFPNYGWGTYHGPPDHNVGGDSIYVVKLTDASYKKLMIRVKLGIGSASVIRWADLNGDNESIETLSTAPYDELKHFIHYSLVNKEIVEAEPDMDTWDLLFTRYYTRIPTGPSSYMNYMVTGVLNNSGASIAKVTGIPPEKATESDITGDYSDAANTIGSDWKESHPITHAVSLADSTSYFIQSVDGNTYQLYFTNYTSLEQGDVNIKVKTLE